MNNDRFSYQPGSTHSTLLEKIKNLDNAPAWTRFHAQYAPFIYRVARQRLSPDNAEEIVQIVLAEFAQSAGQFTYDRKKGKFKHLLCRRIKQRTNDRLRDIYKNERQMQPYTDDSTPDKIAAGLPTDNDFDRLMEEDWQAYVCDRALKELQDQISPEQFQLFHAYVIEEWPVEEVITKLGVSRFSVYKAKSRIKPTYLKILKRIATELDTPVIPES